MSAYEVFIPLMQIGRGIVDRRVIIDAPSTTRKDRNNAKKEVAVLEQKLNEDATALVRSFLSNLPNHRDLPRLEAHLKAFFQDIRGVVQEHPEDDHALRDNANQAINFTSDRLLTILRREASKGPTRRHLDRFGALYVVLVIALAYFGARWYSQVPVRLAVETRSDLLAGIDALEKVARYDDWMGSEVRRGGWLKGPLLWPVKPTQPEVDFAVTTLSTVLTVHDYAQSQGLICGSNISLDQSEAALEAEIDLARHIESFAAANPGPDQALLVTLAAMEDLFPCEDE